MKSNNETVKRYEISLFLCPLSGDETSSDQISPKRIFFFFQNFYHTTIQGRPACWETNYLFGGFTAKIENLKIKLVNTDSVSRCDSKSSSD